ncbi:MAG: hypothetical protein GTO41_06015, partial [Burkholderiales bacterium]|nr:hypothetical protein [Burkholderiales bacterium]
MNFLFAVSLLTLLIFYFTGRFVILKAVSAAAAVAVPYFIAGYTLATLMLTVLVVAKTAIRFEAIATAARAREPTSRSVAAQLLL